MADECLETIKRKDFGHLKNVAFLEEANNRFTTTCRRFLNKRGYKDIKKTGPMYYIVEDIENLADQYKYLCNYLFDHQEKKNIKIRKEILAVFQEVNMLLRKFYEIFYNFNEEKLIFIGKSRKEVIKKIKKFFDSDLSKIEIIISHYLLVIAQKIFCLVGPYLILAEPNSPNPN